MDAISDVSRASQIFSSLPTRPPLPDPLDLHELLGFNDAFKREPVEEVVDLEYFDKNRIFINHVDSFLGKHIVSVLAQQHSEELNSNEPQVKVEEDYSIATDELKTDKSSKKGGKNKKAKDESKSKSEKAKSPKSTKGVEEKAKPRKDQKSSSSPKDVSLEEVVCDLSDNEEGLAYDTSRLTVAEYYEMLELEPGLDREEFLKQRLAKCTEILKSFTFSQQTSPGKFLKMSVNEIKKNGPTQFQIIGTLKNNETPKGYVQEGVSEIIQISQKNNYFLNDLVKCGVFIYIVNEDIDQVAEATLVINALLHFIQEIKEKEERQFCLPKLILISSFMTWSLTKPLNPKEPELPFSEKDCRKRNPHPNYQLLYELEEQVLKVKSSGEMDAIILVCGIPYGHEEGVLSFWFEMAYHNMTLPVYGSGSNVIPIIHVDNLGLIVREVLEKTHAIHKPFIFAKDPISYTIKDLVKAISSSMGSGCYKVMPAPFAFLEDEVTQDIYDQFTAHLYLESCYPLFKEEDIKWKYEMGFVENISQIVKEFMDTMKPKPIKIIFYSSNEEIKNIASKLSEYFYTPYLHIGIVLREYVVEMLEKIKKLESLADPNNVLPKASLNMETILDGFDFIEETEECQEDAYLEELNLFRKLNIKDIDEVDKLTDFEKISILKRRLKMNTCVYRGYILDSFPETLKQAEFLFAEDDKPMSEKDFPGGYSFLPDYVIHLEKLQRQPSEIEILHSIIVKEEEIDENLGIEKEMSMNLESSVDEIRYEMEEVAEDKIEGVMTGENESYFHQTNHIGEIHEDDVEGVMINEDGELEKKINNEDFTEILINYLLTSNEKCKLIRYAVDELEDLDKILNDILKVIEGSEPTHEGALSDSPEMQLNETTKTESKDQEETEDNVIYKTSSHEMQGEMYKMKKEGEEAVLAIRSYPLLSYLISFVYPTLTNAILEVTAIRPDDPLDFLAEYLFKNNPDGRMFDPSELRLEEELRNQKKGFPKVDSIACFA